MITARTSGKPFLPGNRFGKGRPAGSRNKATLLLEQIVESEGEGVVRTMIQRAKKGDPTCMKLTVERAYPVRRERPMHLDLPEIRTAEDLPAAFRAVMRALAQGDITSEQAERVTRILEFGRKAIETGDLARGLAEVQTELRDLKEDYERRAA